MLRVQRGRTLRPASFTSSLAFTRFTSACLDASLRRPTMTAGLRQVPAFFRDVPGDTESCPEDHCSLGTTGGPGSHRHLTPSYKAFAALGAPTARCTGQCGCFQVLKASWDLSGSKPRNLGSFNQWEQLPSKTQTNSTSHHGLPCPPRRYLENWVMA